MRHINQQKEFLNLIKKYLQGDATQDQLNFIKKYYETFESEEEVLSTLSEEERRRIEHSLEMSIMQKVAIDIKKPVLRLWQSLSIAASIALIALSIALYSNYSKVEKGQQSTVKGNPVPDIAPGGNKALLTLADGSVISLNDISDGEVVEQAGIKITKKEDGILTYTVVAGDDVNSKIPQFNAISTPKGGQYKIVLPDGTAVWLNAASSLRYPTIFTDETRKVELTGEAYFEVNRQWSIDGNKKPFLVSTNTQVVEVLGTHFNLNAYTDEPFIKTTLLEGSVKVSGRMDNKERSVVLKPGEQSIFKANNSLSITRIDTENVVAWKSGLFQFQNSDIESVMRELSRWYDVKVEFEGKVPDIKLWGKVYRNVNASEALKILSYFDLKYRIVQKGKEKKIIIS